MNEPPFEIRDHTADILLHVRGHDLPDLFGNAAEGLYAAMGEIAVGGPAADVSVTLAADDIEDLLHDWLADVLYRAVVAHTRLGRTRFDELTDRSLRATAEAALIDVDRSAFAREVKAVTYHGLAVRRTPTGFAADVVLDI